MADDARMTDDLLIVLCQSPRPGEVMPGLTPPLNDAQSCAAYVAMVLDTELVTWTLSGIDVWFACEGEPSVTLTSMLRPESHFTLQRGEGPGDRIINAFAEGFEAGYQRVAVIGTESPDLPPAYVRTAFERLRDEPSAAVFGPTLDGGVYLIGLSRPQPQLFWGIRWNAPDVWDALCAAADRYNIPLAVLPRWQDVDTWIDLRDCLDRRGALHLTAISDYGILDPQPDFDT